MLLTRCRRETSDCNRVTRHDNDTPDLWDTSAALRISENVRAVAVLREPDFPPITRVHDDEGRLDLCSCCNLADGIRDDIQPLPTCRCAKSGTRKCTRLRD